MTRASLGILSSFAFALILAAPLRAGADDRKTAEPASFHSRGFGYVAEIFPPHSRRNPGDRAFCYFYQVGYPGTDWTVDPRLVWSGFLFNREMPYEAIVSMDGVLVTLNDWGHPGFEHAIVVYDKAGHPVADLAGDQLLADDGTPNVSRPIPQEDGSVILQTRVKYPNSPTSRLWEKNAKFYFAPDGKTLHVALNWGPYLEIQLQPPGGFKYGHRVDFPALEKVLADTNSETEVWQTSLRFSSMTDVLAQNRPGQPKTAPTAAPPKR